jgi:tRNA U34 2-thiouridine synthase MnmA/TrmU
MERNTITALALFSGGLDSILSCRVVAAQGIRVKAVKFVTPFFGYDLLARQEEYIQEIRKKYDIDVVLHDISDIYLPMVGNPPHGYGKNFNPCLDCKILMLIEARKMLDTYGASFIITGEVVGQRPMSQRLDTLRVIARDCDCEDILVRPLCAQSLNSTKPEQDGLVDREQLLNFKGRSRKDQIALARRFSITDYPAPAGGCVLTDLSLSRRVARFYEEQSEIVADDIVFILHGRHFRLPHGGLLAMGRDESENEKVVLLQKADDWNIKMPDWPGPTAILRYAANEDEIKLAAGLVVRYSKKIDGKPQRGVVVQASCGDATITLEVDPLADTVFQGWLR